MSPNSRLSVIFFFLVNRANPYRHVLYSIRLIIFCFHPWLTSLSWIGAFPTINGMCVVVTAAAVSLALFSCKKNWRSLPGCARVGYEECMNETFGIQTECSSASLTRGRSDKEKASVHSNEFGTALSSHRVPAEWPRVSVHPECLPVVRARFRPKSLVRSIIGCDLRHLWFWRQFPSFNFQAYVPRASHSRFRFTRRRQTVPDCISDQKF